MEREWEQKMGREEEWEVGTGMGMMQFMLSTASFLDFYHFEFPYCKQQKLGGGLGIRLHVLSKQVDYI